MAKLTLRRAGEAAVDASRPRLVGIMSGKGGVGKSVMAYNLACVLADRRYRVLLVDCDFGSGNLHILANRHCYYGIQEFAENKLSLREAVTGLTDNLDLLAAIPSRVSLFTYDIRGCVDMVHRLREQGQHYDLILLDHGSGRSDAATAMAHASDTTVLVVVPELLSISDAYGLYRYLHDTDDKIDCRLLLNRLKSRDEGQYVFEKFRAMSDRFVGSSPRSLGYVREDEVVSHSVATQRPLHEINDKSPVLQALKIASSGLTTGLAPSGDRLMVGNREVNRTPAAADIRE
ncbi:AAA family ATPase [candidate division GN15 bacterium]|nr:AAA family ATPase [candidate division GN15 bacterium]